MSILAWLADVLDKIANRHPMSKSTRKLPWAYINNGAKRQAATETPLTSATSVLKLGVGQRHPLRTIRVIVDRDLSALYSRMRPSIP